MKTWSMRSRHYFLFSALPLLISCGPKIPMVSVDNEGRPQVIFEKSETTSQQFAAWSKSGEEAVMNTFANATTEAPAKNTLKLHTVGVGIGFSAEAGIGPLKFGVDPKIRFVFSDREKPTVP